MLPNGPQSASALTQREPARAASGSFQKAAQTHSVMPTAFRRSAPRHRILVLVGAWVRSGRTLRPSKVGVFTPGGSEGGSGLAEPHLRGEEGRLEPRPGDTFPSGVTSLQVEVLKQLQYLFLDSAFLHNEPGEPWR